MRASQFAVLALISTTLIAACSREAPQPAGEPATQTAPAKPAWPSFAEGFIESRFKVRSPVRGAVGAP